MTTRKAREAMTPSHPRWKEFVARLEGPEGCNFRLKDPKDRESIRWTCAADGHPLATKILKAMRFDVARSIAYFREHGGYCDCEVVFNVKPRRGRRPKRAK